MLRVSLILPQVLCAMLFIWTHNSLCNPGSLQSIFISEAQGKSIEGGQVKLLYGKSNYMIQALHSHSILIIVLMHMSLSLCNYALIAAFVSENLCAQLSILNVQSKYYSYKYSSLHLAHRPYAQCSNINPSLLSYLASS